MTFTFTHRHKLKKIWKLGIDAVKWQAVAPPFAEVDYEIEMTTKKSFKPGKHESLEQLLFWLRALYGGMQAVMIGMWMQKHHIHC